MSAQVLAKTTMRHSGFHECGGVVTVTTIVIAIHVAMRRTMGGNKDKCGPSRSTTRTREGAVEVECVRSWRGGESIERVAMG